MTSFYKLLETFKGFEEGTDRYWWKRNSGGNYRVNAAYKDMNQISREVEGWPWKHIWKAKIPYKVSSFVWLRAREAVLTQDNLKKRGIIICSRCCLSGETDETVGHL